MNRPMKSACGLRAIHPEIVHAYLDGTLLKSLGPNIHNGVPGSSQQLPREAVAVLRFLRYRILLSVGAAKGIAS